MKKRSSFLVIVFLVLVLVGCDVFGVEFQATVEPDGSGVFSFTYAEHLQVHEDGTRSSIEGGCTVEDDSAFPLGYTADERVLGDDYWCTISAPFGNLEGLQAFLEMFGQEAVNVKCLGLADDTLVLDMSLLDGMSAEDMQGTDARGDEYFMWQLTVPGPVNTHNADSAEGNTLTWRWDVGGSNLQPGMPVQVNMPQSGQCPFGSASLFLLVESDGTGSARLTMPVPANQDSLNTDQLVTMLQGLGWANESITETGQVQVQSRRDFQNEGELRQVVLSVPGFTRSGSFLTLEIMEDEVTSWREFTFTGRMEFVPYRAYWAEVLPDALPPSFRFDLSLPGTLESSPGMWSDPNLLTAYWDAETGPGHLTLKAVSSWMPEREPVDPETAQANLEEIEVRFVSEIPVGQVITDPSATQSGLLATGAKPGWVNNLTGGGFACGDYQTTVLRWLDGIRLHPDPAVRAQVAGLDYGPIEAYRGGHQAVVIFPIGEDWRDTGHVLDPWPTQRPEVFTMDEWEDAFWWGVGPGEGAINYPQLFGNPSAYPGTEPINQRIHPTKIGIHSPVTALVTSGDNRLGMLPDGSLVNEIPGADFYPPPQGFKAGQWLFGLPAGEYQIQLTGTDSGDYHILIGDKAGQVRTFGGQPIKEGEQASLALKEDNTIPLLKTPEGSEVEARLLTEETLSDVEPGAPPDLTVEDPGSIFNRIPRVFLVLGGLGLLGLCLGIPFLVVIIYLVSRRK